MWTFKAELKLIGINPFICVPEKILKEVFTQAGKDKGHLSICGTVNNKPYKQTLVKYIGEWRLYINTTMLKNSPKRIGEQVEISVAFDPSDRSITPHPKLTAALLGNKTAKTKFDQLSPSRQKEIVRYILALKREESIDKNVKRAIQFLLGKANFIGRDKP